MPDAPPARHPVLPAMTTDGRPAPKLSAQPCTPRPSVWCTETREGSVRVRSVGRILSVTGELKIPPASSRKDIGRTPARWSVGIAVVYMPIVWHHDSQNYPANTFVLPLAECPQLAASPWRTTRMPHANTFALWAAITGAVECGGAGGCGSTEAPAQQLGRHSRTLSAPNFR